jgi:hypothetical protein
VPRKAAPLLFAAIALAILACIAWIKWNERGSEARLRADLERQLRAEFGAYFADCDLSGLSIRNLKVQRPEDELSRNGGFDTYLLVTGEVVVPRRRFATQGSTRAIKNFFDPTGNAVFEMTGYAQPGREKVAVMPFLGPVHPVWSWSQGIITPPRASANEMAQMTAGGANALFDAHFNYEFVENAPPQWFFDYLRFYSSPELHRTGRLDEAAALWNMDWEHYSILQAQRHDLIQEATSLLHDLEKAGPGHEKAIAQMRAVLKK